MLVSTAGRKYPLRTDPFRITREGGELKVRVGYPQNIVLAQSLWLSRPMTVEDKLAPQEHVCSGDPRQTI